MNDSILIISNNSTNKPTDTFTTFSILLSYIALVIIVLGVVGNTISFLIFRLNKEMREMPSMVYLSFICVSDTFSLFIWNLNHYLFKNHGFKITHVSDFTCKFFSFLQYFSLEASGWLLCFLCIDRYFTVIAMPGSFVSKLPFGTVKSATIWSILIFAFFAFLHSYLLFADRQIFHSTQQVKLNNQTIINLTIQKYFNCYELRNGFKVYLIWQNVHLILYVLLPFVIMLFFNLLLIEKTFCLFYRNKSHIYNSNNNNSANHHKVKNLTLSLMFITFSFIFSTLPATIAYGFFFNFFDSDRILQSVIIILDYISFSNHASIFINSLIGNLRFRKIVLGIFSLDSILDNIRHIRN